MSPIGSIGSQKYRRGSSVLVRRLVYVAFFLEVGLLLVIMPWWPALWDHNYFVETWPALQPFLTNNFVRGAVTGLGFVNLFAGFAELALIFQARPAARPPLPDNREPGEISSRP